MSVFTWFPDASVRMQVEPRVASARFGDGYEQRAPMGINTMPQTWSLTFTGSINEVGQIEAFLREHMGVYAFDWTTPDGEAGRFVCRSWNKSRERGVKVSLSADFEQVYGS